MITVSESRQLQLPPSGQQLIQHCGISHFQVELVFHTAATALVCQIFLVTSRCYFSLKESKPPLKAVPLRETIHQRSHMGNYQPVKTNPFQADCQQLCHLCATATTKVLNQDVYIPITSTSTLATITTSKCHNNLKVSNKHHKAMFYPNRTRPPH